MSIFKVKDTELIMMAHVYHVEADTKEEALSLYENELAGVLECMDEFVDEGSDEGITIID